MDLQVKVLRILDAQRFVSQKNGETYVKNIFVGETLGQYPKKVAFSVMGEERFKMMNIVVGGSYTVSFDVESREWNGKWFTDASAWRAQSLDGGTARVASVNEEQLLGVVQNPVQTKQDNPMPDPQHALRGGTPVPPPMNNDDLPF